MKKRCSQVLNSKLHYNTQKAVHYYSQWLQGLLFKEKIAFSYIPQNSKILDLGCGTGRTTVVLAKRVHNVIGLDIAFYMVQCTKDQHLTIPYLVGDACHIGSKENQFDVVIFSHAGIDEIYPYEKRLSAIREIKRVLKPGGLFIFGSHNRCIPKEWCDIMPFLRYIFKKERNTYIDDYDDSWGVTKIYLTTPILQIKELENQGFKLVKLVPRRLLKYVKSPILIGMIDSWCYYVFKSTYDYN